MRNVIDVWQTEAQRFVSRVDVLPDGCQDVIVAISPQAPLQIQLTPIYRQAIEVNIEPAHVMCGFRLQPGCQWTRSPQPLLADMKSYAALDRSRLIDFIESHTYTPPAIQEALACLAQGDRPLSQLTMDMGVSERTLQRLIKKHTGYPPLFWLRLARARQCLRQLVQDGYQPEIAYQFQFSDQAHMCREIRHWMGVTPTAFLSRPDLMAQLNGPAYA